MVGVAASPAKPNAPLLLGPIAPIPHFTQTPITLLCDVTLETSSIAKLDCNITGGLNPFPPKDRKTLKVTDNKVRGTFTAYPDGRVTLVEYIKV